MCMRLRTDHNKPADLLCEYARNGPCRSSIRSTSINCPVETRTKSAHSLPRTISWFIVSNSRRLVCACLCSAPVVFVLNAIQGSYRRWTQIEDRPRVWAKGACVNYMYAITGVIKDLSIGICIWWRRRKYLNSHLSIAPAMNAMKNMCEHVRIFARIHITFVYSQANDGKI